MTRGVDMRASIMVLIALMGQLAFAQATKPAAKQADVPVKVVVLFSSGVGYFEHIGTVKGDSSTELRFKTQQINDILKSLVLQDTGQGKVSTIVYPSQDPIGENALELSGGHFQKPAAGRAAQSIARRQGESEHRSRDDQRHDPRPGETA